MSATAVAELVYGTPIKFTPEAQPGWDEKKMTPEEFLLKAFGVLPYEQRGKWDQADYNAWLGARDQIVGVHIVEGGNIRDVPAAYLILSVSAPRFFGDWLVPQRVPIPRPAVWAAPGEAQTTDEELALWQFDYAAAKQKLRTAAQRLNVAWTDEVARGLGWYLVVRRE